MTKVLTRRFDGQRLVRRPDQLVVEEPLEIRLDGVLVSTTMRTPGHDFELASGFCFTEGLLDGAPVRRCRYCSTGSAVESEFNVVSVDTGGVAPTPQPRLVPTTSACGICGTTAIDELRERLRPLPPSPPLPLEVLASVGDGLAEQQPLFAATGGVHAAAAFGPDGGVLLVREDIGRHNAVDKLIGSQLMRDGAPLHESIMMVSGRAGFEIVQKAAVARIPIVCAVSAPSSLAVETATVQNMTLVGFLRDSGCNIYSGADRVVTAE
jgi:FdhD protein